MPPVDRPSVYERSTWGVYLTSATMLVRTVYKVRQTVYESAQVFTQKPVYESAQVFTQKHWKRSFTLSLPGVECTVALLLLISSISLTTELRPFQSCRLSRQNGAWSIRDTTLQGQPTRGEPKRSGRASRIQPNRQAKLPVCAVQWAGFHTSTPSLHL